MTSIYQAKDQSRPSFFGSFLVHCYNYNAPYFLTIMSHTQYTHFLAKFCHKYGFDFTARTFCSSNSLGPVCLLEQKFCPALFVIFLLIESKHGGKTLANKQKICCFHLLLTRPKTWQMQPRYRHRTPTAPHLLNLHVHAFINQGKICHYRSKGKSFANDFKHQTVDKSFAKKICHEQIKTIRPHFLTHYLLLNTM